MVHEDGPNREDEVAETEPSPGAGTTVLVVDSDERLRESFAGYLEPLGYEIRTAADAANARVHLDTDVDIALIDRELPDESGDDLVAEIRSRNLHCQVALVTAVDPDFDILEIDCDDYLVKPVERDDVIETVERMAMLEAYREKHRQLSSLRVKRNVLAVEKDATEGETEEFERLERRIATLETEIDDLRGQFDDRHLGYDE